MLIALSGHTLVVSIGGVHIVGKMAGCVVSVFFQCTSNIAGHQDVNILLWVIPFEDEI